MSAIATSQSKAPVPSSKVQSRQDIFDNEEHNLKTRLFEQFSYISDHLHWAGLPGYYVTLTEIGISRREIIRVDDHGLHLVWRDNIQFVKPLSSCFADFDGTENLQMCTRGFLYSYTRLIKSELDFAIAVKCELLPKPFDTHDGEGWAKWQRIRRNYFGKEDSEGKLPNGCHERYRYGRLRLDRLNMIMWFVRPGRTYFFDPRNVVYTFYQSYSEWLIATFVYLALVLTAMQVFLQASSNPDWLTNTCKYFGYTVTLLIIVQFPLYILIQVFLFGSMLISSCSFFRYRREFGIGRQGLDIRV
jgi:hypothetical protein